MVESKLIHIEMDILNSGSACFAPLSVCNIYIYIYILVGAWEAERVTQVVEHRDIQQDSSMDVGNVRMSDLGYLIIAMY